MINGHHEPPVHTHCLELKVFSQLVLEAFQITGLISDYLAAIGFSVSDSPSDSTPTLPQYMGQTLKTLGIPNRALAVLFWHQDMGEFLLRKTGTLKGARMIIPEGRTHPLSESQSWGKKRPFQVGAEQNRPQGPQIILNTLSACNFPLWPAGLLSAQESGFISITEDSFGFFILVKEMSTAQEGRATGWIMNHLQSQQTSASSHPSSLTYVFVCLVGDSAFVNSVFAKYTQLIIIVYMT